MAKRAKPINLQPGAKKDTTGTRRSFEVVERILELIRTGNLQPGDRLPPERELIKIFGISRPSLREGLRALDTLGVTVSKHGGGAYVGSLEARQLLAPIDFYLSLSDDNLVGSFDCRRLIETEAVKIATNRATQEDIKNLNLMIKAHEDVQNDAIAFRILDARFHGVLWELANNPLLERFCSALYNLGLDVRRQATENPDQIVKSTKDHIAIVKAISTGKPEKAAEAMYQHLNQIENSTRDVLKQLSEKG